MAPEMFDAMNNYNKNMHQSSCLRKPKSNNSNNAFLVYILTALTCSLVFFSSIFWYPSWESLITSLPNLTSRFATPKCLFLVGNLIICLLIGESKLFTSKPSQHADEVYYHEYLSQSRSLMKQQRHFTSDDNIVVNSESKKLNEVTGRVRSSSVNGRVRPLRKVELANGNKGTVGRSMSAEELSKRADDFIARVNRGELKLTHLAEWNT